MRLDTKQLAFVAAWVISADSMAYPQSATDHLQQLIETSAQRLVIAEQIALAKWDSGAPVEDAHREAQVMVSATRAGESRGLDQATVSNFFRAQIEANKLIWRRAGKAPDHKAINLASTIRPELDQVDMALIADLAETAGIRASATCRADMAKAVDKYVSAHKDSFSALKAAALDQAVGAACKS
jgi:chorismate mutase